MWVATCADILALSLFSATSVARLQKCVIFLTIILFISESVVITAVIPNKDNLQLDKAEVTVFSNVAKPPIVLGPVALAEIVANLPTNIQELFFNDASFYAAAFIL